VLRKKVCSTLGELYLNRYKAIGDTNPIEKNHHLSSSESIMLGTPTGDDMKPEDVSQECWDDFVAHRKAKKAIITSRVVKTIREEAHAAGWTLEQALDHMVLLGWRGFKAEWVEKKQRKQDQKQDLWNQLTGRNIIDLEDVRCKAIANAS
jgi:hypothetical protein